MPNQDWMAAFSNRDDLTLCDISFPASHDAGLSEAPDCYHPISARGAAVMNGRPDTICQQFDIAGQLLAGSRAFDVRIAMRGDEPRTIHAEGGPVGKAGGGFGQTARSIFQQVDQFLAAHPGEIVIVRISHTDETTGARVAQLVRDHIDLSRRYTSGPRNLGVVPLRKLRGKAVVIFDAVALPNASPYEGLHRFGRFPPNGGAMSGLFVCGKYAGFFANIVEVAKTAIACGNEHGEHPTNSQGRHDHLFMVYWQEAFNVRHKTLLEREPQLKNQGRLVKTKGTHFNLDYLLNVHRGLPVHPVKKVATEVRPGQHALFRPNWINLDFIDDHICAKVIEFNDDLL